MFVIHGIVVSSVFTMLSLSLGQDAPDPAALLKQELKQMQGVWELFNGARDGERFRYQPGEECPTLEIEGTSFILTENGKERAGRMEIDPTTEPKQIKLLFRKGAPREGIYEFRGGQFRIFLAAETGSAEKRKRPADFTFEKGDGRLFWAWRPERGKDS